MTELNNAEPDVDSMTMEEIEAYQNSLRNGTEMEVKTIEPEVISEEGQTAHEENPEVLPESKPEETKQEVFVSPYLKGKSVEEVKSLIQKQQEYLVSNKATADELEQIYLDNIRATSQIDNQRGEYKKKLKEVPQQQAFEEDDPLSQFDPDTVKATELLFERMLDKKQKDIIKQHERHREENYQYLTQYKQNPAIYSILEPELTKEVTSNPNIIYTPNWVQNSAMKIINNALSGVKSENKTDLSTKKQAASTIGTGGGFTPSKPAKSEDDMSPDEYLAHMKAKGLIRTDK